MTQGDLTVEYVTPASDPLGFGRGVRLTHVRTGEVVVYDSCLNRSENKVKAYELMARLLAAKAEMRPKPERRLIGYMIGGLRYHPSDVTIVYGSPEGGDNT